MRREFIKELVSKLVKNKPRAVSVDITMSFIEDKLTCLDNEDEDEHKTNRHLIRMKELFCKHVVKMWEGTNANTDACKVMNKIVVKNVLNSI